MEQEFASVIINMSKSQIEFLIKNLKEDSELLAFIRHTLHEVK